MQAAWAPGCQTRFSAIFGVVSTRSRARRRPLTSYRRARRASVRRLCCPASIGSSAKLVAEITYLTWTADNRLRHTVYVGLREDKPADQVRREG